MAYKNNDSCLKKVADDEPIFVLRAKDHFAPILVEMWANLVETADNCMHQDILIHRQRQAKIDEVRELIALMKEWQEKNGAKIPD